MAVASTITATSSVARDLPIRTCNAREELELCSAVRLGTSRHAAGHLRAAIVSSRRAPKKSQAPLQINCKTLSSDASVLDKKDGGETEDETSLLTPSTLQVQSLLEEICDGTRIAELKLKVGAFLLHVKRDVGKVRAAPSPIAPVSAPSAVDASSAPVINVPSPAPPTKGNSVGSSLLPVNVSKTASLFGLLEAAADQGLSFVTSPKVGVFRRGRNVRGKIGKPLVDEGVIIKEGQVVGYLEQLGTQQPVEAKVSGEVVQVLWEDGESVGYGDPLIAIRPSFPGIVSRAALN